MVVWNSRGGTSPDEMAALLDWAEMDRLLAGFLHTGTWAGRGGSHGLQAHNAAASRVRGRIGKVFGTAKRRYGLRQMLWLGLARAGLQVRLTAMDYDLRRSWRLLAAVPA